MPKIEAQPGPQAAFLKSSADVVIYGGSAGGGKSFGLLLEPLHYSHKPGFNAVFFRRERGQITAPGSLWDVSKTIYPFAGARPRETQLDWRFPSGATVKFSGMEHDKDRLAWQGSQLCCLNFDELTHFSSEQFFYMLSRNRSTCGVRPYVRATTNPDADSWVADLVSWYINQETGFPIPERSGVLRYFTRVEDQMVWGDTREDAAKAALEVARKEPEGGFLLKSFTFIPAKLSDNPALTSQGPEYLASLQALPLVERERLLGGNWKIRAGAGKIFNRAWWQSYNPKDFFDATDPSKSRFEQVIQAWDTAFSEKAGASYSVCATWGLYENNFYLLDIYRSHVPFPILRREAIRLALLWQPNAVLIEAKASGQSLIQEMRRAVKLPVIAVAILPGDDKVKRASAVSLYVEAGRCFLPEGATFVSSFIEEHAGFPDGTYSDQCLAGDTLIRTSVGERPIQSIRAGDMVATRRGWRRVSAAGCTNPNARVLTLTLSNGRKLTGTAAHPVYSPNRGFVGLDTTSDAILYAWEENQQRQSNTPSIAASPSGVTRSHGKRTIGAILSRCVPPALTCFIGRFGRITTVLSPMGTTSTTRMKIHSTTTSATWSALLNSNIGEDTGRITGSRHNSPILRRFARSVSLGIAVPRVVLGTAPTPLRVPRKDQSDPSFASSAVAHFPVVVPALIRNFAALGVRLSITGLVVRIGSRSHAPSAAHSSWPTKDDPIHAPVSVVAVTAYPYPIPVYNLTVEGEGEYFASGVLVHNCDTTSMALARLSGGRIGVAQYQSDDFEPTGADQSIGEDALPVTASHKMRKADPEEVAESDLNQYLLPASPTVAPLEPLDFSGAMLD